MLNKVQNNENFLEKSCLKIWSVNKKALTLHSISGMT